MKNLGCHLGYDNSLSRERAMNSAGIFPRKPPLGGGSCQRSPLSKTFKPPNGKMRLSCPRLCDCTSTTKSLSFISTYANKAAPTIPNSSIINQRQYKNRSATSFCGWITMSPSEPCLRTGIPRA